VSVLSLKNREIWGETSSAIIVKEVATWQKIALSLEKRDEIIEEMIEMIEETTEEEMIEEMTEEMIEEMTEEETIEGGTRDKELTMESREEVQNLVTQTGEQQILTTLKTPKEEIGNPKELTFR
jgi:predicted ArsR family transcriptional regulator